VQERLLAKAARDWVGRWISTHHHGTPLDFKRPFPWPFRARIIDGGDKYGRYLLYVVCATCNEVLNDSLLAALSDEPGTRGLPLAESYTVGPHRNIVWARWVHENQVSVQRMLSSR
jgi:hypothetical protein